MVFAGRHNETAPGIIIPTRLELVNETITSRARKGGAGKGHVRKDPAHSDRAPRRGGDDARQSDLEPRRNEPVLYNNMPRDNRDDRQWR